MRRKCQILTLGAFLAFEVGFLVLGFPPANAQYFGYSPFSGSASWLWLARELTYPLNRYSSYSTPYYLLSPLVRSASYGLSRDLSGGGREFDYGQYQDAEPINYPRSRTRADAYNPQVGVEDQIQQAHPYRTESYQTGPRSDPDYQALNSPPPLVQPTPLGPEPMPLSEGLPPLAPDRFANRAPLMQAFIDLLRNKFRSDISAALGDEQMCKFARSIGLIDSQTVLPLKIGADRADLIRSIIDDPIEEPASKVAAVRMLLKH